MTGKRTLIPPDKADAIAFHRKELQRLTGKIVELRDRQKYNARQTALQKAKRKRLRELEAELKARHDPFCTCDECYARAQAVAEAREKM